MDDSDVGEAVAALRAGQVVGVPTDTVYGLAIDPLQEFALLALVELKGRPGDRPVALLVATIEQASTIGHLDARAIELAERHWPGPLTLVVRKHDRIPDWIGDPERGTVGLRAPEHPVALRLLSETGPLAVSSANRSGQDPVLDHQAARALFGNDVAVYLQGRSPGGTPSTVLDVTADPPVVLRAGPIQA